MISITQPQKNMIKAFYKTAMSPSLDADILTKEQANTLYIKLLTFVQTRDIMTQDTFQGFMVCAKRITDKTDDDYENDTHLSQLRRDTGDKHLFFENVYDCGDCLADNQPVEITIARQVRASTYSVHGAYLDPVTEGYRIILEF